jgi:hypothetical protein
MRGSIYKANAFHSLKLVFEPDEVKYLSGGLPKSIQPKLFVRGTIREGIIVRFGTEGIALRSQVSGGVCGNVNVARIEAISTSIAQETFPSTRILDEGLPAIRLAPQPQLSNDPSTPERKAVPGPESRGEPIPFNTMPIAEAIEAKDDEAEPVKAHEPPPFRPPARPGIAAGLSRSSVHAIAQKHSSTPIVIDHEPHHQPRAQIGPHALAHAAQAIYSPKLVPPAPAPTEVPIGVVDRVREFWKQTFDVLPLALSNAEISALYKAHGRPEFGQFLDLIKHENDAVSIKSPPAPQSIDKLADLRTALEMVNTLLDEIGATVSVKVDPATCRLVAKRVRVVEEDL